MTADLLNWTLGPDGVATWTPAAQPWDENVLSPLEANWNGDGVGTWTFVDGVISQTDPTADSCLNYTAGVFVSPDYVAEAEILVPSGQDAGVTSNATFAVGTPSIAGIFSSGVNANQGFGGALVSAGPGDGQDIGIQDWVDGQSKVNEPFPTAVAQDEWHTVRVMANGVVVALYLDGEFVFTHQKVTGGNAATPGPPKLSCELFAVAAVGLAQYRNLRAWTRPLPA